MANELARRFRRSLTPAEAKLWGRLKLKRGQGFHFRRQAPIGPYIVDFVCHRIKLVLEVDGGQHGFERNLIRDGIRTKWLESRGYRVMRFWNSDVLTDLDSVICTINFALNESSALNRRPAASQDG